MEGAEDGGEMEGGHCEFVGAGREFGLPPDFVDEEGGVRRRGDLRKGFSHLRTS